MKALFTVILSTILFATASASNIDGIKIAPKANTTNVEVKFNAVKATDAKIVVTNEAGIIINTLEVKIAVGANAINLLDVNTLAEGNYTVTLTAGTEVATTKFMNWKL